jgi:hypothetical protein
MSLNTELLDTHKALTLQRLAELTGRTIAQLEADGRATALLAAYHDAAVRGSDREALEARDGLDLLVEAQRRKLAASALDVSHGAILGGFQLIVTVLRRLGGVGLALLCLLPLLGSCATLDPAVDTGRTAATVGHLGTWTDAIGAAMVEAGTATPAEVLVRQQRAAEMAEAWGAAESLPVYLASSYLDVPRWVEANVGAIPDGAQGTPPLMAAIGDPAYVWSHGRILLLVGLFYGAVGAGPR